MTELEEFLKATHNLMSQETCDYEVPIDEWNIHYKKYSAVKNETQELLLAEKNFEFAIADFAIDSLKFTKHGELVISFHGFKFIKTSLGNYLGQGLVKFNINCKLKTIPKFTLHRKSIVYDFALSKNQIGFMHWELYSSIDNNLGLDIFDIESVKVSSIEIPDRPQYKRLK